MAIDQWTINMFKMEIWEQTKFALIAWGDMEAALQSGDSDRFWCAAQTFLAACGNISKICWPDTRAPRNESAAAVRARLARTERGQSVRDALAIGRGSPLESRTLRNYFEHLDERLDQWARTSSKKMLLTRNIGDGDLSSLVSIDGKAPDPGDTMGYFNSTSRALTFQRDNIPLDPIIEAVRELNAKASPMARFHP